LLASLRDFIIPSQSRKFYSVLNKADFALDSINRDISGLTREIRIESWRLVLGIIVASLIISASMTYSVDQGLSKMFIFVAAMILAYLLFSIVGESFRKKKVFV
jgi:hypothetical protein